jgi:hypothetical protein
MGGTRFRRIWRGWNILHTVRTRGMYTGESSRWLMGHASVSRSTPIPDASDSGQTRLEAAVFQALTSCGEYTPNPAGFVRTEASPVLCTPCYV